MSATSSGRTLLGLIAALAATFSPAVLANDVFPDRPIRIIVPFPPGGMADVLPRIVAEKLAIRLGQPIVIENRPGGTGNVGSEAAAAARPDGHTLLAAPPPPLAINESLFPRLGFDPAAFVPITVIASAANVLAVPATLPVSNVDELIAYAKRQPKGLSYASTGNGGTPHLAAELLKSLTGAPLVHVPYKGIAPAIPDLSTGRVDLMFLNIADALPHLRRGALKVLAVASAERHSALPDVPTIAESIPGFVSTTWYAIVAPPGTPQALADKLSQMIGEVLREPGVAARLRDMTLQPVGSTPAATRAFIRQEAERWGNVIRTSNIKLD
ncbi:MAG TPA: tripartite tricarboxylate transporter substrate binding protein [Burkholderiaceae bacterium]|nr:tripartite tricarboxylate transporter substrate binding protein [Burkholderiaceae bacterium]